MNPKIKFSYVTLFPDLIRHYLSDALLSKAEKKGLLDFSVLDLRQFSTNSYKSVDDKPFGGGDGVVIEAEPVYQALQSLNPPAAECKVIYLSPQGRRLDQHLVAELSQEKHLVFICGRYGGIDHRLIQSAVDLEISVGDYILSGGELAALIVTESVSRLVPGVLGDFNSTKQDSFSDDMAGLLEAPQFTRPMNWKDQVVPAVLSSGHHQAVESWKKNMSYLITLKKRPDLLVGQKIDWKQVQEFYNKISQTEREALGIQDLAAEIEQRK